MQNLQQGRRGRRSPKYEQTTKFDKHEFCSGFEVIGPYSLQSLPFSEKNSDNKTHPMMAVQGTRLDESTGHSALSGMLS